MALAAWVSRRPGPSTRARDGVGYCRPLGSGVLVHFARNRGRYDVVHCLSYPFLSVIAIRVALAGAGGGNKVWCEWLECLSDEYWRAYGGRVGGVLGRAIQGLSIRAT